MFVYRVQKLIIVKAAVFGVAMSTSVFAAQSRCSLELRVLSEDTITNQDAIDGAILKEGCIPLMSDIKKFEDCKARAVIKLTGSLSQSVVRKFIADRPFYLPIFQNRPVDIRHSGSVFNLVVLSNTGKILDPRIDLMVDSTDPKAPQFGVAQLNFMTRQDEPELVGSSGLKKTWFERRFSIFADPLVLPKGFLKPVIFGLYRKLEHMNTCADRCPEMEKTRILVEPRMIPDRAGRAECRLIYVKGLPDMPDSPSLYPENSVVREVNELSALP